jgi:hypothetical protein
MNRELCIARLFTALVIASAMHPLCAGEAHGQDMGPLVEVFNCPSGFAETGSCGVSWPANGGGSDPFEIIGATNGSSPGLVGSQVNLVPAGAVHNANNLDFQTAVNVQQFSTTLTYVPNGQTFAFILSNNTNAASAGTGSHFTAGAGCEASFFQGFPGVPNNTFAIELDQYDSLTAGGSTFTYSSVQYYAPGMHPPNAPNPPGQSPCNPNQGGTGFTYAGVNKVSTSPVPLNNPVGTPNTTTGHTYSVTITYDGSNLTISLYDVTLGNSCPGASCFTYTWTNVNVPSIVGGNTAWAGLAGATGNPAPAPLLINSWSYGNPLASGCTSCTSQVAMGVTALMTGQTQTVATLTNLETNPAIIPSFVSFALANKLDVTTVVGEDVGLAFAGNTSFVTNFGGLSLAAFTQSMLTITGINQAFTASQVQFFINLYTANGLPGNATPTAAQIQAAAYGVVFGLNVAQNLVGTGSSMSPR